MSLSDIRSKNEMKIYDVSDKEFKKYGTVIRGVDISEFAKAAEQIPMPESGSVYHASEPCLESLDCVGYIRKEILGEMDYQFGYCFGYGGTLCALEWHNCNEFIAALEDAVVVLGKLWEMKDGCVYDTGNCKAFFVPKNTVLEFFSDTLHHCPCQAGENGYRMIVGLARGTNCAMEQEHINKTESAKNTWLIRPKKASTEGAGMIGDTVVIKY